jgi:hypothetical protein
VPTLSDIAQRYNLDYATVEVIMRAQLVPLDDPGMVRQVKGEEPWNFPRRTAAAIALVCRLVISGITGSKARDYARAVLVWCDAQREQRGYIDVLLQFMDGVSILITKPADGDPYPEKLGLIHMCEHRVTPEHADVVTILRYTE